jgi:hypothetical protein
MIAKEALIDIGGRGTNSDEMLRLPLLGEVPEEQALTSLKDRKLP